MLEQLPWRFMTGACVANVTLTCCSAQLMQTAAGSVRSVWLLKYCRRRKQCSLLLNNGFQG
jgi:hypothetical protein